MSKISRSEAGKLGSIKSAKTQQLQKQKRIDNYLKSPSICKKCNKILEYKDRNKKFCNSSCSALYNNQLREPRSAESKKKVSLTINKLLSEGIIIPQKGIYREIKCIGPYTPIKRKNCTNCNKEFWAAWGPDDLGAQLSKWQVGPDTDFEPSALPTRARPANARRKG